MNTDNKISEPRNCSLRELTDDQLLARYDNPKNYATGKTESNRMFLYSNELQRRETVKTNKVMRKWTVIIGVATIIILVATIINVLVAKGII